MPEDKKYRLASRKEQGAQRFSGGEQPQHSRVKSPVVIERLEDRVLYSADVLGVFVDAPELAPLADQPLPDLENTNSLAVNLPSLDSISASGKADKVRDSGNLPALGIVDSLVAADVFSDIDDRFKLASVVSIGPLNDPGSLASVETEALDYAEGDSAVALSNTLVVDAATVESAAVRLTGNYSAGEDVLLFTDTPTISGSFDSSAGLLTLLGVDGPDNWQDALRNVRYHNASDTPDELPRTVEFAIKINATETATASRQIAVSAVNDPPMLNSAALPDITEDSIAINGDSVAGIFADEFSDVDSTFNGIAIVEDATTAEGAWQYRIGGGTWFDIGPVSESSALVLDPSTLLRFIPASDFFGAVPQISVHAIDDTYAGQFTNNGSTVHVDLSVTVGDSAFSAAAANLTAKVTPVGPSDLSSGVTINTNGGNDSYFLADNGGALLGGLTEVTMEVIYSIDSYQRLNALVSYSAVSGPDTLKLVILDNGRVNVGVLGVDVYSDPVPQLLDGEKHSVAASWESSGGLLKMYVDGYLVHSESGVETGQNLLPGGTLILGMEQDTPGGSFETDEVFSGTLFDVRLWDEVRTAAEINANHTHKLHRDDLPVGLVANWQMDEFNTADKVIDIVSGNNLVIQHSSEAGFSSNTPIDGLSVAEGAANGFVVGALVSSQPVAGEDLIQDGGFTASGDTAVATYTAGDTIGTAWQVDTGDVDIKPHWQRSPLGGIAIDLNGNTAGSISQVVATEVGKTYVLKYAFSGNFVSNSQHSLRLSVDGVSADSTVSKPDDWSSSNLLWSQRSMTFTATSTTTDISFTTLTSGNQGPLISDVQLVEIDETIAEFLALHPQLTYDTTANKFYQIDTDGTGWATAQSRAVARELNGVSGRLITIADSYENSVVRSLATAMGSRVWLGATDQTTEGHWRWHTGSDDGELMWTGSNSGSAPTGVYTNWKSNEPNDQSPGEDHAVFLPTVGDGDWNDAKLIDNNESITEWDADVVLAKQTYSLHSDPGGALTIDAETGLLTVADGSLVDYEAGSTYDIVVRVTNAIGEFYDESFSIPIENDTTPELINLETSPLAYTENDGPVVVTNNLTISDGDSTSMQSATVDLGRSISAEERLVFSDYGPFTSSMNVSNTGLTITGNASVAEWESALRSVTFENISETPVVGLVQIHFSIFDGTENSVKVIRDINVGALNDAPILSDGTLPETLENTSAPTGESIGNIFTGQFSDVDGSFGGIAVTADASSTEGTWQYSVDNGTIWENFAALSEAAAVMLGSDARLRFVPATDYVGLVPALTLYGVDDSYASGYTSVGALVTTDVSIRGESTPFAISSATIQSTVVAAGPTDLSGGVSINMDGGNDVYLLADDGGALLGGLSEFTIESSFSIDSPVSGFSPLFSYAAVGNANAILIGVESSGAVFFHLNNMRTDIPGVYPELLNGDRHSIAVSWDSLHGEVSFYIDGEYVHSRSGFQAGYTVQPGGELLFGQDQDGVGSSFDADQVLTGTYYDQRVWNEVRSGAEISGNYLYKLDTDSLPSTLIANWQMDSISDTGQIVDIVAGNDLGVAHATDNGFSTSTAVSKFSVFEGAADGTVIGTVVPGSATVTQDLILDGRFTSDGGAALATYTAGNTIGGVDGHWVVASGNVGVEGHFAGSPLGGNAVDLDGSIPGAISQTFSTEVGRTYVVNFALTGNFGQAYSKSLTVSAGSSAETFVVYAPIGWSSDNLLWNQRSMTFTASAESTTLTFASDSVAGSAGAVIGDVQVVELPVAVTHILSGDPNLTYDAGTGKFYQPVSTVQNWPDARDAAIATTLNGIAGQLVTINSAYENTVVQNLAQTAGGDVWLGASDIAVEGHWHWMSGQQEGLQFWDGAVTGVATNGAYTNWRAGEPNDNTAEDAATYLVSTGLWNDRTDSSIFRSVVEWDAQAVLAAFHYSIESDPSGAFGIDSNTGVISVSDGSVLDYEASQRHDIQVRVTDAAGEFYEEAVPIHVLNVNERPLLSTLEPLALDYTENMGAVAVSNSVTLADIDTATLASATVVISGGYQASEDQLDVTGSSAISGSWDIGSGTLTLTGTGTVAEWQSAIRSVTYNNSSDTPDTSPRTIDFVVSDGALNSNTVSRVVAVTEVNDAPVILDGVLADVLEDVANPVGDTGENVFAGQLADADGAVELIAIAADATTTEGEWQYSTDAGANWYAINAVDESQALVIDTNDKVRFLPAADYYGAVPALTVYAVDDSIGGLATIGNSRVIADVTVRGGDTPYSVSAATITSNVISVFDPPVNLGSVPSAATTIEDIETVINLGGIAIDARDHSGLLSLRLTAVNGQLGWIDDPALSFSSTGNQLAVSGDAASINAYLGGNVISYLHDTAHVNGSGADTVTVSLEYGGVSDSLGDISISITPVNDAPATESTVDLSVDEDTPQVIPLSVFGFSDIHDGDSLLQIRVVNIPQFGVLTNDGSVVGNGTSIPITDIAASKLLYAPPGNANGLGYDQMTFRVQDDGGTTDGGIDQSMDTGDVIFNVAPVNDLPLLSVNPLAAIRGESHVLGLAHIAPYEPDVDSAQRWVTVSAVPTSGVLQLSGIELADGDRFSHADLVAGSVRYVNHDVSADDDAIGLVVYDQGIAATTASAPVTLTINVQETHPHAVPDNVSVDEHQRVTIAVLANDIIADEPLDTSTVVVTRQPSYGTVSDDGFGVITYLHDGGETTADSFAYSVTDTGGDTSLPAETLLSIVPVNDAPEVLTAADAGSYLHRSPPVLIAPALEIKDPDDSVINKAVVSIAEYEPGVESLSLGAGSSLAYNWDAIGGVLTVSGGAGIADYQDALRALSYQSEQTPSATALTRTLSITVTDNAGATSDPTEIQLMLTVPDQPVVISTTNSDVLVYVEDASPLTVDSSILIDSLDSRDITGARWQITGNYAADQDALLFNNTPDISASWEAISGTLILSGVADAATYQSALQTVAYVNSSQNPDVSPRSLSLEVESSSGQSELLQHSVQLLATNDPPTALGGAVNVRADVQYEFSATDFGFVDQNERDGLKTMVIESLPGSGQLLFGYSLVTTGQEISRADLARGELKYTPALNVSDDRVYDLFEYRVRDEGGVADGGVDLSTASGIMQFSIEPVITDPDPLPESFQVAENAAIGDVIGQLDITTTDPLFTHLDSDSLSTADAPDTNRYAANGDFRGAAIGPWHVILGSVDLHGEFWQRGSEGGLALELNGDDAGAVEQHFTTTLGARYEVTFQVSGDFRSASASEFVVLEVSAGDQRSEIRYNVRPDWSEQNPGWQTETVSFTATTPVTTLTLKSLSPGSAGPLVSDIQVRDELSFDNQSAPNPFAVDGEGIISVANGEVDFETRSSYLIDILVSGQDGREQLLSVPIAVLDINEKPILQKQQSVQMIMGTTATIGATQLAATDVDNKDQLPGSIVYEINQTMSAGELILNNAEILGNGDTFTQSDLNGGRLTYANSSTGVDTDKFTFTLKDGGEDGAGGTFGELTINVYEPLSITGSDNWAIVEQGVLTLTPEHLSTAGGFTSPEDLLIELSRPSNTTQLYNTQTNSNISQFTMSELLSGDIQLQHNGSQPTADNLQLSLYRTDIHRSVTEDTRLIHLQVADLANAPVATDSLMFTDHLTPLTITAAQIGFSDGDDGDVLKALRLVSVPHSGTLYSAGVVAEVGSVVPVSLLHDGLLRYLPDPAVAGTITDHINFTVIDSGSLDTGGDNESSRTSGITITVVSDHAVVANPDTIIVPEGESVSVLGSGAATVAANDIDLDTPDSALSTVVNTSPLFGSLEFNADGSFIYTHDGSETINDSFSYRIFEVDNSSRSSVGAVDIQITPQNDSPLASSLNNQVTVANESLQFTLPDNLFTDVDDAALTVSATLADGSALPDWLEFDPLTGKFSGSPGVGHAGSLRIVVVAEDSAGLTAQSSFEILVEPPLAEALPELANEYATRVVLKPQSPSVQSSTAIVTGSTAQVLDADFTERNNPEVDLDQGLQGSSASFASVIDATNPLQVSVFNNAIVKHAPPNRVEVIGNEIAVEDGLVVKPAFELFSDDEFLPEAQSLMRSLDNGRDEIRNADVRERAVQSGVLSISASMSIGYVLWLIRSGLLLSSAFAAMPAWRWIDPLPVLKHYEDDDEEDNAESLQSMVSGEELASESSAIPSSETPDIKKQDKLIDD